MNKPPSGSITFSTFGVTVASGAARLCSDGGTAWVMSALLVTAVRAGLTQQAKHRHTPLCKQSAFKRKDMTDGSRVLRKHSNNMQSYRQFPATESHDHRREYSKCLRLHLIIQSDIVSCSQFSLFVIEEIFQSSYRSLVSVFFSR